MKPGAYSNNFICVQVIVLTMSATSGVYTGKIDTSPQAFWAVSTSDSPSKAEIMMQQGDGRLSPLGDNETINITYVDASPHSVWSILRVAVPTGTIHFVPTPLLTTSVTTNQSVGVVLRKAALNTGSLTRERVDIKVRSHSMPQNSPSSVNLGMVLLMDTETVTLNETFVASGIFSGYFRVAATPSETFIDAAGVYMSNTSILEAWYPEPGAPAETGQGADGRPWPFINVRVATDAAVGSPRLHVATPGAGERLTITVVDPDADVRFGFVDVVTVKVSSSKRYEGDERVLLTETLAHTRNVSSGGAQGIFTGVIDTRFTTTVGPSGDGVIHVNQDDTLTFEYHEVTDAMGSANVIRRSQVVVSAPGQPATISISPRLVLENEQLCVSLTDDVAISSIPEVQLQWRTPDGRDRQVTTTLANRTGNATHTSSAMRHYQRCLDTTISGTHSAAYLRNGDEFKMFEVPRGSVITAVYKDALPFGSTRDLVAVSRKGSLQVSPLVLGMGRTMSITVTDKDLNQNASNIETASVSVSSTWAEEGLESVVLTENSLDSEVFTGLLRTILNLDPSPASCDANNGCNEALSAHPAMHVRQGDLIHITYYDVCSTSIELEPDNDISTTARIGVTGRAEINKCANGGSTTCKHVLLGGDALSLTVVDADIGFEFGGGGGLATGAPGWTNWIINSPTTAVIDVDVTTSKDAELETVVLYAAISSEPGTYTGVLDTCMGSKHCVPRAGVFTSAECDACSPNIQGHSNNGVFTVRPGDHLTVSYKDAMPQDTRTHTIKVARIGVLRLSPSKKVENGDLVAMTVIDDDVNTDLQLPDMTTVRVASPVYGEPAQVLPLIETGADTGHFTGVFRTCLTCNSAEGLVRVEPGDFITCTYEDAQVPAIIIGSVSNIVQVVVAAADTNLMATPKVVLPGETVFVVATNSDIRQSSDSLKVTVVKSPSLDAEYEELLLQQVKHQVRDRCNLKSNRTLIFYIFGDLWRLKTDEFM